MNSTSPEEVNLLIDKLYSVGGVRPAIEKLSTNLTLSVGHETNALLNINTNNNNNTNNDGDGSNSKTEKTITSELAHLSITYQENSTTGQPAGDKIVGLSVDDRSQDDNCGNETGKEKEKEKEVSIGVNDPLFKCQINELTKSLPGRPNDIEKNKQMENNDSINANYQKTNQTDKNMLIQKKTLLPLPVTQSNGPAKYFNFNLNLAPISTCCLLQLLATRMARENIIQRQKEDQQRRSTNKGEKIMINHHFLLN
jgi:hypothetical protein